MTRRPPAAVRYAAWIVAISILGLGTALVAAVSSEQAGQRTAFIGVTAALTAYVLLLGHQPLGRWTALSAACLVAAFAAPMLLARDVVDTSACGGPARTPCDPRVVLWHPGVLVGLFFLFLLASLATAAFGFVASRR